MNKSTQPDNYPRPNQKLSRERERRGWSQAELAEKIGCSVRSVGRWEQGRGRPQPSQVQKLTELFGKDAEELGFLEEISASETQEDQNLPSLKRLFSQEQEQDTLEHSHIPGESSLSAPSIQSQPRISRRMVVIGLGALTTVAVAGSSLVWLTHFQGKQVSPHTFATPTTTPILLRMAPFTYYGHTATVVELAWSPDSKHIASASFDTTVHVWNVTDRSDVYIFRGHTQLLKSVAWSPIGDRIASGAQDLTAQVWDAGNGGHLFLYNDGNYVNGIAWSSDGKLLADGSGDGTVRVWNAATGKNIYVYHGHTGYLTKVRWSPDGERIASGSGDQTVQVWNAVDGGNVYIYRGHFHSYPSQVTAVVWSPDGKRIASSSSDRTVQVWNADDGSHVYTYHGHTNGVNAVTWSPDGKRIASASTDGTVQIWRATDGGHTYIYRGHGILPVLTVAWSPDGKRIASGGNDTTVQVWQAP